MSLSIEPFERSHLETFECQVAGSDRVRGVYVDTGLMRDGETAVVARLFESLGHGVARMEDARQRLRRGIGSAPAPSHKTVRRPGHRPASLPESGFERKVWQFPVILIPVGAAEAPDSVVLRPVDSVDGMTARSVLMEEPLLRSLARQILEVLGVCAVFYDLTHKPPGTIEWE